MFSVTSTFYYFSQKLSKSSASDNEKVFESNPCHTKKDVDAVSNQKATHDVVASTDDVHPGEIVAGDELKQDDVVASTDNVHPGDTNAVDELKQDDVVTSTDDVYPSEIAASDELKRDDVVALTDNVDPGKTDAADELKRDDVIASTDDVDPGETGAADELQRNDVVELPNIARNKEICVLNEIPSNQEEDPGLIVRNDDALNDAAESVDDLSKGYNSVIDSANEDNKAPSFDKEEVKRQVGAVLSVEMMIMLFLRVVKVNSKTSHTTS